MTLDQFPIEMSGNILTGWILVLKQRQCIKVTVVQLLHQLLDGGFDVSEINPEPKVVQLGAFEEDVDGPVVTMWFLAVPSVAA